MTEAEWLECTDPFKMWLMLENRATSRKRRLFGCACCRFIWDLLVDERSRCALEVAETFADGVVGEEERRTAQQAAQLAALCFTKTHTPDYRRRAAADAAARVSRKKGASQSAWAAASASGSVVGKRESGVLRDLFGNSFHPLPILDLRWLAWNDGTSHRIAEGIYGERAFDRLPILADALEKAGCTNTDILNHCRQPGEHVRGCWVIDLILGKE